jgi:branched-chain amino acid aminotransferase
MNVTAVRRMANVNGQITPLEEARISILDRGFLYGDSVYEVVRTYGGKVFALAHHLDRMERSAARIALALPPRAHLEAEIARTLAAAQNAESYVRIVVTRGEGRFGLAPNLSDEHRVVIIVRPFDPPGPEVYEKGLRLAVAQVRRNPPQALDPRAKTGNYLNSILALREAHLAGCDDALMLDLAGRVTEGSTSNVFFVKDSVLVTPPTELGLLEGVTRALVIELARSLGVRVHEEPHGAAALLDADEVFLTSTLREVMPVTSLVLLGDGGEGRVVGDGRPGPLARRLHAEFRARVASGAFA